jgi:hypothetical protein
VSLTTREQGDLGEYSALEWLLSKGVSVAVPFGHSPDWDIAAEIAGRLVRVQVKTTTSFRNNRWVPVICTRGGNQSWNRITKRFHRSRCDYLFVLVGDGRRWFIPSDVLDGETAICLGGTKYAQFEVEPGLPIPSKRP